MAQSIIMTSGSRYCGSPIVYRVTPTPLGDRTAAFHNVIVVVTCGKEYKFSAPVINDAPIDIDISSACRSALDDTGYAPDYVNVRTATYTVKAYDEWMDEKGNIFSPVGEVSGEGGNVIYGTIPDAVREGASAYHTVSDYTLRPTTPQIVMVGETHVYPTTATSAAIANLTTAGLQTFGGRSVYALPADTAAERLQFRFINSFGVLESVSVPRYDKMDDTLQTSRYAFTRVSPFNKPTHALVRKINRHIRYRCYSGPVDVAWADYFHNEFLAATHAWVLISGRWRRVHLIPEEDVTLIDRTTNSPHDIYFTAELDIEGSPTLGL